MRTPFRAGLGFLFGFILSAGAFFLSGAGHGTYAPMFANVSVLAFIPVIGILLGLFGTPFLWALYFVTIPTIASRPWRVAALVLVALGHTLPGLWVALEDPAFTRVLAHYPSVVLAYGLALTATILWLAWLASSQPTNK